MNSEHRQLIKMPNTRKKKGRSTSSFVTMAMPQGIGTLNTVKANYEQIRAGRLEAVRKSEARVQGKSLIYVQFLISLCYQP